MRYLLLLIIAIPFFAKAQPAPDKPLNELVFPKESSWPQILSWTTAAKNNVTILPRTKAKAEATLLEAQVTTRSALGAVIYETGGLLVDSGWIRILGSGSPRLGRTLTSWNKGKGFKKAGEKAFYVLVADDVTGGFFALNEGGLSDTALHKIFYFSPDNAQWENLEMGYPEFLHFIFNENLDDFYEGLRWKGWEKEVHAMDGDSAFMFYPYLFTKEGADIEKLSRTPATVQEVWDFYFRHR